MVTYNLTHANIALAKYPFDSPQMASFFEQVERINQIAYNTEGFIDEPALIDKGSLFSEPNLLNVTRWHTIDALQNFTYRSDHAAVMQVRKQWFLPQDGAKYVLFWLPSDTAPTEEMIAKRIAKITKEGPSLDAFNFQHPYAAPNQ